MLIAITGKAHSGKDTIADYFIEKLNAEKYAFAFPIKKMAIEIFGFSEEQMYNQDLKEIKDEFWGISPREFMINVGTKLFRNNFNPETWIKCAERYISKNNNKNFIISDIRFNNELDFVRRLNGIVIKIKRENNDLSNHILNDESEAGISDKLVDYILENNSTKKELFSKCDEILKKIRKIST